MSSRLHFTLAALALAAWTGCAGRVKPVLDLTPWMWTWSQATPGAWVIRYGFPDDPSESQTAGAAVALAGDPVVAAMLPAAAPSEGEQNPGGPPCATRFASFRYGCAREDRAEKAACSVYLDFWLLALETPLATATFPAYQERFEREHPLPAPLADGVTRDSRGRDWLKRTVTFESGAAFAHYSRPLDARFALAVTSYTSRAPDRVVARDLARDAIDRIRFEAAR